MKLLGALMLVLGMAAGGTMLAADTQPATKPALPACCGNACKRMGACCAADAAGKVTCPMGGSCCLKADATTQASSAPAMGGMKGMGGMGGM